MAKTPGQLVSSGKACLRPARAIDEVGTGYHEAAVVDLNAILEPLGIRIGANEQKQMAERAGFRVPDFFGRVTLRQ